MNEIGHDIFMQIAQDGGKWSGMPNFEGTMGKGLKR